MSQHPSTRRGWLAGVAGAIGSTAAIGRSAPGPQRAGNRPASFGLCLNTSTIRGQELSLVREVEIAAQCGYDAIEPWIREIDQHVRDGGSLADLRKRIADLGLTVESAIGFAEWIVDDDARRGRGMEEAKRSMDLVAEIGGKRLAAPPAGATDRSDVSLLKAAHRYRALLELGDEMGVVPQVEIWGFSQTLTRLGEAMLVAVESGHPQACVLPDVYHLFRGGSDFTGLRLVSGQAMHVIHVNDYPAHPPREQLTDAHRVYPGDGVAPLETILRDLRAIGFRGFLSLELFNREYWNQDPATVARTGLDKIRAVVEKSLG